ncbi:MAG TPA: mannonate dehydratase [Acetobacteraceae bacterium]|nr:mannonate dehydratase [Acetobacteraceae bacterium]
MKLTMVAQPPSPVNLALLRQLGIAHAVHYDMHGLPDDRAGLRAIQRIYRDAGLDWTISESGPAIDRIVLGLEGWRDQLAAWNRTLPLLGEMGVEVVAYNFMPQLGDDAMVVRTSTQIPTRGGALTSQFRADDLAPDAFAGHAPPLPLAAMWTQLERFLEAVLPVAERAGVRLAMHPDDPPFGPLCGYQRIMGSPDDFARLFAFSSSPSNAMTLCVGCFAERGVDIPSLVARFSDRIAFVHVRDIRGTADDFIETFADDGQTDLFAVFQALRRCGYEGLVRSDHAPLLATDAAAVNDGYAMQGHIFAIGYLRGLMQAVQRA